MTAQELIEQLQQLPPDTRLFMSSDEEGNSFQEVGEVSVTTAKWHFTSGDDEWDEYKWVDDKLYIVEEWGGEAEETLVNLSRTEAYIIWPEGKRYENLFEEE